MTLATGLALGGQRPFVAHLLDLPAARVRPDRPRRLPERRAGGHRRRPGGARRRGRHEPPGHVHARRRSASCRNLIIASPEGRAGAAPAAAHGVRPGRTRSRCTTRAIRASTCRRSTRRRSRSARPRSLREGSDLLIVGFGPIVMRGVAAAEPLRGRGLVGRRRQRALCQAARPRADPRPGARQEAGRDARGERRQRWLRLGRPRAAGGRRPRPTPRLARAAGARSIGLPGATVRRPRRRSPICGASSRIDDGRHRSTRCARRSPALGVKPAPAKLRGAHRLTADGPPRRIRLDQLLVDRGLAETRSQAQAMLLWPGSVRRRQRRRRPHATASRATWSDPHDRSSSSARPRYVSRGGEKLAARARRVRDRPRRPRLPGRRRLDRRLHRLSVAARRGRVYALDVGRGQLAESLRATTRVISMERTHAGRLDPDHEDPLRLPEPISLAVIDVSFISLTRILRGVVAQLIRRRRDRGAGQAAVRGAPRGRAQGRRARPGRAPRGGRWRARARRGAGPARCRRDRVAAVWARRATTSSCSTSVPAALIAQRIGFAFNPTRPQTVELRERVRRVVPCARRSRRGRPRPPTTTRWCASCRIPTAWSCWAATARSCAPRGRWRRSTCRSSASTRARSASCRRSSRWPRCGAGARSPPATTRSSGE